MNHNYISETRRDTRYETRRSLGVSDRESESEREGEDCLLVGTRVTLLGKGPFFRSIGLLPATALETVLESH